MSILLFRLDERLIHGQVFLGWANFLKAEKLVILNDQVASTPSEKELYLAHVPPEIKAAVFSLNEGLKKIFQGEFEKERTIVLLESPQDLLRLAQQGVKIAEANLGGMYFKEGRKQLLPYVYLSEEEMAVFEKLFKLGIKVFCQDLPGAEKKDLEMFLHKLS